MRTLALLAVLALSAAAAAHAEPCKSQGAADAKELTFDLKDPKILQGLHVAFQLGLLPKEFPEDDIAAIKKPCSRGAFPFVNELMMELRGEDTDTPPRWAISPTPGPTVYVAMMPQPEPARLWAERQKGETSVSFGNDEWMFALALTLGDDKRLVFHFFDKIPDDTRLKELFRPIVIGKGKWQVGFDTTKRQITPNAQ
jgi:hypothetical protein